MHVRLTLLFAVTLAAMAASPVAASQSKVAVCHRPSTSAERMLEVGAPAVAGHLRHGDTLGVCGSQSTVLISPRINEVFYEPLGSAGADFIEIVGPAGFSLQGWELRLIDGATGSTYLSVVLPFMVIPASGLHVVGFGGALQDGPDAVQLRDGTGALVDAVQYGNAGANNAGEGNPAPDVPAGKSLSRDAAHTDTDDNATDFSEAVPTPDS